MPTKKIVLSNEPFLLEILKNSFFQREGFEMVMVQDGQTGLQAVEAEEPTLVVFDLDLLGEQALECCRSIKADPLLMTTPVLLLLQAGASEELVTSCWDVGCDALVPRPLSPEHFVAAACDLLGISTRLEKRFPVGFHLDLFVNEQKKHVGSCVNFNAGGMFIATEKLFPVDTQLLIEFTLPGFKRSIQCPVRVAWVNHPEWLKKSALPCGLGVQFQTSSPAANEALQSFLDSLKLTD